MTFFCVTLVLLYMTIGYAYRGISGTYLEGDKNAYFMGYYILAVSYAVPLIIVLGIDAAIFLKILKLKKGS